MYERKISAVAVLDDDEHLVSYMTVNDVIYLNAEIHPRLFTPIRRFLKTLVGRFSDFLICPLFCPGPVYSTTIQLCQLKPGLYVVNH
jgi:hypothetical protein